MKRNVSVLLIVLCILAISNLILFSEDIKYGFQIKLTYLFIFDIFSLLILSIKGEIYGKNN
ncbi:hypothetical protein ES695_18880 [Candidatus Atribacteria bacterium 1244-E10-H5-B2]|nr:MAG: hypothetical protein ES695_18880 [Candidatus Atribacteria bacterium 1244-E10-H5-B2]